MNWLAIKVSVKERSTRKTTFLKLQLLKLTESIKKLQIEQQQSSLIPLSVVGYMDQITV